MNPILEPAGINVDSERSAAEMLDCVSLCGCGFALLESGMFLSHHKTAVQFSKHVVDPPPCRPQLTDPPSPQRYPAFPVQHSAVRGSISLVSVTFGMQVTVHIFLPWRVQPTFN